MPGTIRAGDRITTRTSWSPPIDVSRRAVADRMAGAAADLLDSLDDEQRADRGVAVPGRRRAPAVVLHACRPRRAATGGDASAAAAAGDATAVDRAVVAGVRHRGHDHRAGERARRGGALHRPASAASGAATRACTTCASSANPSAAGAGVGASAATTCRSTTPSSTVSVVVVHAVLPRRQPGVVTAARAAPAASARRRRGPRARAGPVARRRAARRRP